MKYFKLSFGMLAFFLTILISSCTKTDDTDNAPSVIDFGTAPSSSLITTGVVNVITENTVRYHTINFDVAPYTVTIMETKENLVLVDLGPAPIFGDELKAYIDAINKPSAVIITHNHGDHYGGAGNFADLDFYAEANVAAELNTTDDFTALHSDKVIGVSGTQTIGELAFVFNTISNSETGENGYIYNLEHKVLFSGDLIYNLTHLYLREYTPKDETDEIDNWIDGLKILKNDFSDYNHVFVGHNNSRSDVSTVIDENIAYLQDAQGLIKGTQNLTSGGVATTNQEVVDELQVLYPNYKAGGLFLSLPDAFFPGDTGAVWF